MPTFNNFRLNNGALTNGIGLLFSVLIILFISDSLFSLWELLRSIISNLKSILFSILTIGIPFFEWKDERRVSCLSIILLTAFSKALVSKFPLIL
ncbi:hypothetical protein BMS3Abin04_02697 [bacterium BMS3Abin04]|nr:hypothetical protein BMS3Abin04_02697 [bacterium BMS3Abin04]